MVPSLICLLAFFHAVSAAGKNSTSIIPKTTSFNLTTVFNPCSGFDSSASDGDKVAVLGSLSRKIVMTSLFGNRSQTTPLEIVFEMHGRREKLNLSFLNSNASSTIKNSWISLLGDKVVLAGTKRAGCTLELGRNFKEGALKLAQSDVSGVLAAFPKIPTNPRPTNASRTANVNLQEAPVSVIRLTHNGVASAPLPISGVLGAAALQPQLVDVVSRMTPIGDFYTAVVVVRAWDDYDDFSPSREEASRLVFSDDGDSIKTFWGKSSYGKIVPRGVYSYFDGYYDVFQVDVPSFYLNNICPNMHAAGDEATAILWNQGVDLFGWYGSINFVFSRYDQDSCDGRAFALVPGQSSYYPYSYNYPLGLVMKHETGHTFYLDHSNSLDCYDGNGNRAQYYSPGVWCSTTEYNDQYSIMAYGMFCDVEHQGRDRFACGWLDYGTEVIDVPAVSGQHVYTLNSLDHPYTADGSIRLLRIPLRNPIYIDGKELEGGTGNWNYYVELRSGYTNTCQENYRSPIVSIRLAAAPGILKQSLSIDYRVDTSSMSDAPIANAGGTFVDYYQAVGLLVNTLGDNTAQIVISIDEEPRPPTGGGGGPTGGCSSILLLDKFNDQSDFQTNSLGHGYSTDGTGGWGYYADGQSGIWTPSGNGGGYWYTVLWSSGYCYDISSATGLRMKVATDDFEGDVSFDVGLDINNGNCGSTDHTFKPLGSVTVVGYEGWIYVNLPFNGMLSGDDLRRAQALVFKSTAKTNGKAIYVDDFEFVKCDQCQTVRTLDNFNDAGDLNGNDVTGAAWSTDGTGLLGWDSSTSAHWRPYSTDSYLYTTLWSNAYCSDFSNANSLAINWWSDASSPVTINVGFDVIDNCNVRSPKFILIGTVTLYSNRWTTVSLSLAPLGDSKSKISAFVVKPTQSSVNQDLYFDAVQLLSCPGI
ncbi:hypothetical protein BJ742DRAFT_890978 [Cladochytrium replicatum]|nr:hypothetical protein BJ742DRAFT_890978 [Cladochytrium replicatum]